MKQCVELKLETLGVGKAHIIEIVLVR